MAGYNGYSMSNNAVAAYEFGEKPISKWTKSDILATLSTLIDNSELMSVLNKANVKFLKAYCLTRSSWHHTSSNYNKTDFYQVSSHRVENMTISEVTELIANSKVTTKVESNIEKWEVEYLVWSGSRKHPKATTVREVVNYDNSKSYVMTNEGKKMIKSNGFKFVKKVG